MILEIDDIKYNVIIVKKNNKNTYIRIDNELNIVVNTKCNIKDIKNLLTANINQINKMIQKKKKAIEKNRNFYFLRKNYDIIIAANYHKVEIIDDKIYVGDIKKLNKWLNNNMKEIYLKRLDYWYSLFEEEIPYPNLKYRNMKTRWGVCNRKTNSITLNTNLIKYDIECLDYVIVHELSHFVEFNHSNNFWKIVSKYCENYKKIRKKLKE